MPEVAESSRKSSYHYPAELDDKIELAKKFKVGDVIFCKFKGTFSAVSFIQMVISLFRGRKDQQELYRMTHAAVVVGVDEAKGRVLVAESMPTGKGTGTRIIDILQHRSATISSKDSFEYHVWRIKGRRNNIARDAAKIAESLAIRVSYLQKGRAITEILKGLHPYAFVKGIISVFSRGSDNVTNEKHAKRLFKKIADEMLRCTTGRQKATGGSKERSFFCSYFAAHVFQQAELSRKLEEIATWSGVKEGLEKIQSLPEGKKRMRAISDWAGEMAKLYKNEIIDLVRNFKLDPKYTSPQEFIEYMQEKNLFRPILKITPPTKN